MFQSGETKDDEEPDNKTGSEEESDFELTDVTSKVIK